jgi:hypothetical protein
LVQLPNALTNALIAQGGMPRDAAIGLNVYGPVDGSGGVAANPVRLLSDRTRLQKHFTEIRSMAD